MLDMEALKGLIQVLLLDEKGRVDLLAQKIFGTSTLTGKSWLVAQWLLVEQGTNPHFKDIQVGDIERTKDVVRKLNMHIRDSAVAVTDPEILAFENSRGSDVAAVQHQENFSRSEQQRVETDGGGQKPTVYHWHTHM